MSLRLKWVHMPMREWLNAYRTGTHKLGCFSAGNLETLGKKMEFAFDRIDVVLATNDNSIFLRTHE